MPHLPNNTISLGFTSSTSATSPWTYSSSKGASYGASTTSFASGNHSNSGLAGVSKDVLRNLQDVVWSDDEEAPECPLCMEELDPSDVNFKPCCCGYQICRFCHHQIIHNLNGLCPACRRKYEDQEIQFQPVDPEEMKRLQQAKALKQKANKQLESLGRRHLRDVRIVRKDMVYVTGMTMGNDDREEFLSLLRSNDYFGQYGKISKIFLRKGTSSSDPSANSVNSSSPGDDDLGIYITYLRREDAARAISALDGYPAPNNPGKTLKASYGSTKYCLSWLRGVKCEDGPGCMGMHEWAGEGDTFTREDMTTVQHAIKDSGTSMDLQLQSQQRSASSIHKPVSSIPPISKQSKISDDSVDSSALPRAATWATRPPAPPVQPPIKRKAKVLSLSSMSKPTISTLSISSTASSTAGTSSPATPALKTKAPFATPAASVLAASRAAKAAAAASASAAPSEASSSKSRNAETSLSSRPSMTVLSSSSTPRSSSTRALAPSSSASSVTGKDSTATSDVEDVEIIKSPRKVETNGTATPMALERDDSPEQSSGKAEVDPELTPSMTATDTRTSDNVSPLPSPIPASPEKEIHINYQPSVQAQALVDDMLLRREIAAPVYQLQSPYPEFDDFMECFADGDFTYRLDAKLEMEEEKLETLLAGVEDILAIGRAEVMLSGPSGYDGIFDPFLDPPLDEYMGMPLTRIASNGGEDDAVRKGSRFGFANRSGPPETAMSALSSLMGSASKMIPDVRAFAQLDMTIGRSPQEHMSNPNYFTGLPGTSSAPVESEMANATSKSSMAYPQPPSPVAPHREQSSVLPPPPPGLGGPANSASFPAYQQGGNGRNMHQAMEQQMLANMHGYQHQFQADGRRTASPGLQQALRGGNGNGGRFSREGYNSSETFPFQDPAILRMGPPNLSATAPNRYMNDQQGPHPYEMNAGMPPYQQQQQQHQQQQQQQPPQPPSQSQQNYQDSITPNARLLQALHEQMGGARAASPANSGSRTGGISRQGNAGFAKMY